MIESHGFSHQEYRLTTMLLPLLKMKRVKQAKTAKMLLMATQKNQRTAKKNRPLFINVRILRTKI